MSEYLPLQPVPADCEVRLAPLRSAGPVVVRHGVQQTEDAAWLTAAALLHGEVLLVLAEEGDDLPDWPACPR